MKIEENRKLRSLKKWPLFPRWRMTHATFVSYFEIAIWNRYKSNRLASCMWFNAELDAKHVWYSHMYNTSSTKLLLPKIGEKTYVKTRKIRNGYLCKARDSLLFTRFCLIFANVIFNLYSSNSEGLKKIDRKIWVWEVTEMYMVYLQLTLFCCERDPCSWAKFIVNGKTRNSSLHQEISTVERKFQI